MSDLFKLKWSLPFSLVMLVSFGLNGQYYMITGEVSRNPHSSVRIMAIKGDRERLMDSTGFHEGTFKYMMPPDAQKGMYKFVFGKTKRASFYNEPPQSVDIIFNNEDIHFGTDFYAPADSLKIFSSIENKIYYDFLRKENVYQRKMELLHPIINFYPEKDEYYEKTVKKYNDIQVHRDHFISEAILGHEGTLAARIFNMYRTPFLDASLTEEQRLEIYKGTYFNKLNFSDPMLLNTSIYADKIIKYLMLYRKQGISQAEQQDEFIKAVDMILLNTRSNTEVYEFVLDYLVRGFERFKFEEVLNHIAENYVEQNCETENKSVLQTRLSAYQKMAIGKIAPDIEVPDTSGNVNKLSLLDNEYVLVIFWASWCPHCTDMLPKVKNWYEQNRKRDIEVFTISIDTSRISWMNTLREGRYRWINTSNLKGWEGEAARDYNIYATPTMFLLDRERKIVAKPISFYELEQNLLQLE